jgi:hypothetical protein
MLAAEQREGEFLAQHKWRNAEEIRQLIHQSAVAVTEGNWSTLQEKYESLSDLLFYLED